MSDHLSCCPSLTSIRKRHSNTWLGHSKNQVLNQINICIFAYQPRTSKQRSNKTSCNGKQYAMYRKRAHSLWSNPQKSAQALVQPGRIARTESQQLTFDGKGSLVSGLPSELLQNFTLTTDRGRSTESLHLASPIWFSCITTGAHIETCNEFQ